MGAAPTNDELIVTTYSIMPGPERGMDWSATSDDYDYCAEEGGSHPVGNGATEADAINDYLAQVRTGEEA